MDKCDLCQNRSNLEHILNWCPVALTQQRFTWRHDSVLNHLTKELKKSTEDNLTIYSDIPGHKINGGTIPPDVLTTGVRPDIVILDRKSKKIDIFELTCSFEKNISSANRKKSDKYLDLESDLKEADWTTSITPFEVGARGQVTKKNTETIQKTMKIVI